MISEASEALIKHCIMLTDTDVTHLKFISQILCQANSVSVYHTSVWQNCICIKIQIYEEIYFK